MTGLMKYCCSLSVALVSLASNTAFAQTPAPELGPNLVRNSGFDNDVPAWQLPADVAEVRKEQADVRNGIQSLRFANTDPAIYKTVTQVVPAEVGDALHFSVWIKGQNITSVNPSNGAGIYMEGLDEGGGWVTGSYAASFSGTYDWQQSAGVYRVPAGVAKVVVGLYMRKDTIGTAWFDDVEVRAEQVKREALHADMLYPNYRGMVLPYGGHAWQARIRLFPPLFKTANTLITSTISDRNGKVLATQVSAVPVNDEKQTLSGPTPSALKTGEYTWKLEAVDASGTKHASSFTITVVPRMPKNYVDAEGFTVADGKRFFPLGVYMQPTDDKHLKRLADAGFNTVLSYSYGVENDPEGYLERARRNGLRVIFSIKDMYPGMPYAPEVPDLQALADSYVTRLRDKPALLSWYINDELEPDYLPKIEARYDRIKKLDPGHLAFSLLIDPGISDSYFNSTDVLGSDPYPVTGGNSHLRKTTTYTRLSVASSGQSKSTWMVLQMFDFAVYGGSNVPHQPTREEMLNQAYQAIIGGARGLIFYSYFDLWFAAGAPGVTNQATFDKRWPAVTEMSQELRALSPALLNGKDVPLSRIESASVEMRAIRYRDEILLLVANPFRNVAKTTLKLPRGWKPRGFDQAGMQGAVYGGQLTITVPPIGSGVFRLVKD